MPTRHQYLKQIATWALAFGFFAWPGTAPAGVAKDPLPLKQALAEAASNPPGNAKVSIFVIDVMSGTELFALNPDQRLNPASNTKVVTAACALERLGAEFRYQTTLHGKLEGGAVRGPIYLKGHGDPTLGSQDLWTMARELAAAGIRRVEGGVVVDDTYFDQNYLPPAFEQQPNEDSPFRASVSAASLNENAIAVTIRPGETVMAPARVDVVPSDYAILTNDATTMGDGVANPKIAITAFEGRNRLRVYGQVPLGSRAVTYYKRIDNPSLFTGYGLRQVLQSTGITVGGSVSIGPVPPGTPQLSVHLSQPLSTVLLETGKMSNNFVTESVLKTMGAEYGKGPGTWALAVAAVGETLARFGLAAGTYTYRNGSGLFNANAFSARELATVLRAAYQDSGIRDEFVTQLATGGVDGTIKSRFTGPSTKRLVRAKTGTLDDVSSLTGYVFDREGRQPIVFSILVNNAEGFVSSARTYQERIVTAIADFLNK